MKKQHKVLALLTLLLFHSCSTTKPSADPNTECEEYFTYLRNTVKRQGEPYHEKGFRLFYVDEKIQTVRGVMPTFSNFLQEFIQHKDCFIGKPVSVVKSLFLPGDVPEKWEHHLHEIFINVDMLELWGDDNASDVYPVSTIVPYFDAKGTIKRIEITYMKKLHNKIAIHFL